MINIKPNILAIITLLSATLVLSGCSHSPVNHAVSSTPIYKTQNKKKLSSIEIKIQRHYKNSKSSGIGIDFVGSYCSKQQEKTCSTKKSSEKKVYSYTIKDGYTGEILLHAKKRKTSAYGIIINDSKISSECLEVKIYGNALSDKKIPFYNNVPVGCQQLKMHFFGMRKHPP